MLRQAALLSTLTLSLLLAACSKDEATTDDTAVQATPEAPAEAEQPERKLDVWQTVGPLLAGSYSGACLRMPDARKLDGTITIGADGKVSANDLNVDFRTTKLASLMRSREGEGHYRTIATLSIDDTKAGLLSLVSDGSGKENTVSLAREDVGLMCSEVKGSEKLNAQPLYMALSKLLDGKKQTVGCLDTKNLLTKRDTDISVENGVIRIGADAFDMKAAVSEGFIFADGGRTLSLAVVMPEERTINVSYDGSGKLVSVMAHHKQESTHFCSVQN